MKRQSKFRPGQMVEPVQPVMTSFELNGVTVEEVFNPKHSKLRGDHPAVKANPGLFKAVQPDEDEPQGPTAA